MGSRHYFELLPALGSTVFPCTGASRYRSGCRLRVSIGLLCVALRWRLRRRNCLRIRHRTAGQFPLGQVDFFEDTRAYFKPDQELGSVAQDTYADNAAMASRDTTIGISCSNMIAYFHLPSRSHPSRRLQNDIDKKVSIDAQRFVDTAEGLICAAVPHDSCGRKYVEPGRNLSNATFHLELNQSVHFNCIFHR
jgi:hypothetical protein